MIVELFTICDAATDYGGRLNILGALEGIAAPEAPIVQERFAIAARIRFCAADAGEHVLEVRICSGQSAPVVPPLAAKLMANVAQGRRSAVHNVVLNLNRVRFPSFGEYKIQLWIDAKQRVEIPLIVAKLKRLPSRGYRMEN